jgi:hypothetical protein
MRSTPLHARSEIPFAVAGAVFVERQRFKEGVADAHSEAALR